MIWCKIVGLWRDNNYESRPMESDLAKVVEDNDPCECGHPADWHHGMAQCEKDGCECTKFRDKVEDFDDRND